MKDCYLLKTNDDCASIIYIMEQLDYGDCASIIYIME